MPWTIIATWSFSFPGIKSAAEVFRTGGSALDAVEEAGKVVEDDPEVDSVGYGGLPNASGEVELDAAVMDGRDLSMGAIAGIRGFRHPISIARRVLTDLPHNLLVGAGAEEFAVQNGFERRIMMSEKSRKAWEERMEKVARGEALPYSHDTVGIVALDQEGNMFCGTSTSGLFMKHKGRVGDSPLPGCGFYVDNAIGGAAATGVGEDIMRGCTSFYATELMGQGLSPQKAAEEAIRRTHMRLEKSGRKAGHMSIVCLDNKGNFGSATNRESFEYAIASEICPPAVYKVQQIEGI